MQNTKLALIVALTVYCLLLAPVFAIPTDTPIYWTDDFSQNNVYQSANIYNGNWTYQPAQNFTVAVEYGHLTIKYQTATSGPAQFFKVWRGISKNENGIYLKWKISKSISDKLQLGVSADGAGLQYFVEFGWDNSANVPAITVAYTNSSGKFEYSGILGTYQYSAWYWVELTYTSPVHLYVKVTDCSNSTNVMTFNTTDVRHSPSELWATAISVYGVSPSGPRTVYWYVDYAQFSAPYGSLGVDPEIINAITVLVITVGMLSVALGFLKKIGGGK